MASNNITSNQFITYMLSTVAALTMMNAAPIFTRNFGQNTLIFIVIIAALTIVLLLAAGKLMQSCSYQSPYPVTVGSLGKWGGKIFYSIICLYLVILSALALKIFIYIINHYYLQQTPLIIISILLILPTLYTVYGGLRVFGHTSSLLYLLIGIFLVIFFFTKSNYTLSNIFPLVDHKLKASLPYIPWSFISSGAILSCFFFIPAIVDPKHIKRSMVIFTILFLSLLSFTYIIGRAYFGEPFVELILPFFNLSSSYAIGPLERLDVIFILIFIPVLGLFNSFYFLLCHKAQKELFAKFNTKHPNIALLILAVIIVALATWVPLPNVLWNTLYLGNISNLVLILILFIIYFIYFLRKRRGKVC